jgi:uncharacterized protein YodC (DUF2158 family)
MVCRCRDQKKGGNSILAKKVPDSWEAFKKQFPKGAKVQLNVGGPVMAVQGYVEPSFGVGLDEEIVRQVRCQWFSGKKLESGRFEPETLVLVKDDAKQEKQSS